MMYSPPVFWAWTLHPGHTRLFRRIACRTTPSLGTAVPAIEPLPKANSTSAGTAVQGGRRTPGGDSPSRIFRVGRILVVSGSAGQSHAAGQTTGRDCGGTRFREEFEIGGEIAKTSIPSGAGIHTHNIYVWRPPLYGFQGSRGGLEAAKRIIHP